MRPVKAYEIGLVWIFPICLALHGLIWITTSTGSSLAVYAMKLALLPFVVLATLTYRSQILNYRSMRLFAYPAASLIILSVVIPFTIPDEINVFYYISDTIGALIYFMATALFYVGLRRGSITISDIERISTSFLVVISVYIIIYFFISGGQKINLPPEMHLSIAIAIGAYFFRLPAHSRVPHWVIILVTAACVLSQFRMNIGILGIALIVCWARATLFNRLRKSVMIGTVLLSLVSILAAPLYWNILIDRAGSLRLADLSSNSADPEIFEDQSLNQRFVERSLIMIAMNDPAVSLLFGKGAGAQYDNLGNVLPNYGERVHHAHSTPFVVLLRMGLFGVIIFFVPLVIGLFTIFSRDDFIFRSSLCLCLFYVALFFDQYLFWGVQFACCTALWIYSFERRSAKQKYNLLRQT